MGIIDQAGVHLTWALLMELLSLPDLRLEVVVLKIQEFSLWFSYLLVVNLRLIILPHFFLLLGQVVPTDSLALALQDSLPCQQSQYPLL